MKKRNVLLGCFVALVMFVTGCSKDPLADMTQEESRIYITNFDQSANFNAYRTYSISDSVAVINNGQTSKDQTAVDVAFVSAVKAEMNARGYQQVARTANPDLAVNVNRIFNTNTGVIQYNNYFNMYGGMWDPFFYGYPGYGYFSPFSYATYTIREGALSVDLLDLKNAATNNRIQVIWTGLIRGSGIFNSNTASSQVKALFDQSTYIKTN